MYETYLYHFTPTLNGQVAARSLPTTNESMIISRIWSDAIIIFQVDRQAKFFVYMWQFMKEGSIISLRSLIYNPPIVEAKLRCHYL